MSDLEVNLTPESPFRCKCCRDFCDEIIVIQNRDDFNAMKDHSKRSIYHYPSAVLRRYPHQTYVAFGIRVRIFCYLCTPKLVQCRLGEGNSQGKRCENYDTSPFCPKHKCFVCKRGWMYKVYLCSSLCDNVCCYECYKSKEFRNKQEKVCNTCCIKIEINKIVAVLHNICGDKYDAIYYDIAQYSYGRLINCCNDNNKCTNIIAINTGWDLYKFSQNLWRHDDLYGFGYIVPKKSSIKNTVKLYGVKWRIFCEHCSINELERCVVCEKFESNLRHYPNKTIREAYSYRQTESDDGPKICALHPYCMLCNEQSQYPLITCGYCRCNYCVDCGLKAPENKLCRNCCVWEEYQLIYDALYESLYECDVMTVENILGIIAWYSIGYVLSCCNFDYCNAEICIVNKYEFYQNRYEKIWDEQTVNEATREYGWYSVEKTNYFDDRHETHWYIYNKEIRVFCKHCKVNCCVKCKYPWCGNQELYYLFCRNHVKFCELCGIYPRRREHFQRCKFCYIDICGKCIGSHEDWHKKKQYLSQLKRYGLTKYDNDPVYNKICKPYSVV